MRTRRKGRWLPKQPRLGARMCQGTFFFIYREDEIHKTMWRSNKQVIFKIFKIEKGESRKEIP